VPCFANSFNIVSAVSLNFSDTTKCTVLVFVNLLHNGQSTKEEDCICRSMIYAFDKRLSGTYKSLYAVKRNGRLVIQTTIVFNHRQVGINGGIL